MKIDEQLAAARAHQLAGRFVDAEKLYRAVLDADPRNTTALRGIASVAHITNRFDVAATALQRLVEIDPNDVGSWSNLAICLSVLGDTDSALQCYQRAIAIAPNEPRLHYNLGTLLKDTGDLDGALVAYKRSIDLDLTGNSPAWNNYLYLIHFHPDFTPQRIFEEHQRWTKTNAFRLSVPVAPHTNDRSPDRKLRIGYVSPLLREHTMASFILPLFELRDASKFEVTGYGGARRPDAMTERYRAAADRFRDTAGFHSNQLYDQIRADQIDILIDLNLHMADDRLDVFARKPAPVQVTYLGYPSTTGLKQIDWRITDRYLDPLGENDAFYTEKSFRLPWNFHWQPVHATPEVNGLPAVTNGFITFGCLNSFTKVTPPTVDLWGKVLGAVPNSRLIVMTGPGAHRKRLCDRLSDHGIVSDRVEFVDYMPQFDYLATYHRIDIALDTFPCPGHATTCDALWMGVPLFTLPATTAISRGGISILNAVGKPEWIANSIGDYVQRIAALAADTEHLKTLRAELRPRLRSSPLMNAGRFVQDFEAAYRKMWRAYLDSQQKA